MILPNGFQLYRDWSALHFSEIEKAISWSQQTIKLYGKEVLQPRLTSWMGTGTYTYSGRKHEPKPLPEVVALFRDKLEIQSELGWWPGIPKTRFNSVLGNLYRNGQDSVSWHSDNEKELGSEPVIASLSFGASRRFLIRHKASKQTWDIELQHGDLLIMSGRSQLDFQHSIPKTKKALSARINLTFRNINGI